MSYKTELHCHTSLSGCSEVPAADVARKYIDHGYTTVVITNHFKKYYVGDGTYREAVDRMFDEVDMMQDIAGDSLIILPGMELTFECMPNDFLIYGLDRETIGAMDDIFDLRPHEMHRRVSELGGIMIQAHPFRYGQTVINPADVDGIEIFNGHLGQHSHNDVAKMWTLLWMEHYCRDGGYILTSGSDHHHTWQTPTAGIFTEAPITTVDGLLSTLRSGDFTRITASLGEKDY